jgi:hypothetical protein
MIGWLISAFAIAFRLFVALLGGRDLLLCAKHLFGAARNVVARLQPSEAGPAVVAYEFGWWVRRGGGAHRRARRQSAA